MNEELVESPVSREIVDIPAESPEHIEVSEAVAEPLPLAEAPKLSKYEVEAMAKGWRPKAEFSGDPDEFRSAKEWLERGELLETIHSLNRQVKEQKEVVDHLAKVSKKVEEHTRERTIAELEAKHREAVEIGDVERAAAVAKDMVKAHAEVPIFDEAKPVAVEQPQEVKEFLAKHSSWLNDKTAENAAMFAYALRRESEIGSAHPGIELKEALALVEADVKRTFPHRFVSAPMSAVSAPAVAPVKSRDIGVSQLPAFHQKMVKTLQRSIKDFDVKSYINNLKKAGEI